MTGDDIAKDLDIEAASSESTPILRRLAAVLAMDVAGYARLMSSAEEDTYRRVAALMGGIVQPRIAEWSGRVVKKTGDGALVEFPSIAKAVACALAIQRRLAELNQGLSAERRIDFRIGINYGHIIVEPDDIYGDGVNIAARLESLASPGGVCASAVVFEEIRDQAEIEWEELGSLFLKNIVRPVHVFRFWPAGIVRPQSSPAGGAAPGMGVGGTTVPGFGVRPAIAVLPFGNFGNDSEQEYLADGITEDIITNLSSWRVFPVIARNSTFTYKGRSLDAKQIGQELGVRYIVEGSIRKIGGRLRLTAELVDASSGLQIIAERYDRDLADIFALQDELVESIVGAISPELLKVERERAASSPIQHDSAYDCFMRGLWHHYRYTAQDNAEAQSYFKRTLELEPGHVQARAALAIAIVAAVMDRWLSPRKFDKAFALAEHAVRLDARDPTAQFALGISALHTRRVEMSIAAMQTAVRLNPSYAAAHAIMGHLLTYIGREAEALISVEKAIRLSPHDPRMGLWLPALAGAKFQLRLYEDAVAAGRQALSLKPGNPVALRYVSAALGQLGRAEEAAAAVAEYRQRVPTLAAARQIVEKTYRNETRVDHILDGLSKAGLS